MHSRPPKAASSSSNPRRFLNSKKSSHLCGAFLPQPCLVTWGRKQQGVHAKVGLYSFQVKTMFRPIRRAAALTALVAVLVTCNAAQAQVKRFKITGAGIADHHPIHVDG